MKRIAIAMMFAVMFGFIFCQQVGAQNVRVVKNDSFWKIAKQFHVSWVALKNINRKRLIHSGNFDLIYPDQIFELPPKKNAAKHAKLVKLHVATKITSAKVIPSEVQPLPIQAATSSASLPVSSNVQPSVVEKKPEQLPAVAQPLPAEPKAATKPETQAVAQDCKELPDGAIALTDEEAKQLLNASKLSCQERKYLDKYLSGKALKVGSDSKKAEEKKSKQPNEIMAPKKDAGITADGIIKAFYGGCSDILSECKGGKAEGNIWLSPESNYGLYLMGVGATGKVDVPEEQLVWYKIAGAAGIGYRNISGKNSLLINEALFVQTFKSSMFSFNSSQVDLMALSEIKFQHQWNHDLLLGAEGKMLLPIETLNFKSELPDAKKSDQTKGEINFFAQKSLSDLLKLRLNISPLDYQAADSLTGAAGSIELNIGGVGLEFGVLGYPWGIPNALGTSAGKLTRYFVLMNYRFGNRRK